MWLPCCLDYLSFQIAVQKNLLRIRPWCFSRDAHCVIPLGDINQLAKARQLTRNSLILNGVFTEYLKSYLNSPRQKLNLQWIKNQKPWYASLLWHQNIYYLLIKCCDLNFTSSDSKSHQVIYTHLCILDLSSNAFFLGTPTVPLISSPQALQESFK